MEVTKGKLKNLISGKELALAVNPSRYELSQSYDFALETQLAKPAPLVAFRCGGAASLKLQLVFDRDAGVAEDGIESVHGFLKELNKIDEATASVPGVEFKMGTFVFQGYFRNFRMSASRFDPKGQPLNALLDVELISNGTYENGGDK